MIPDAAWMAGRLGALGIGPGLLAVGVSGGPDSLALLRLLHAAAPARGLELVVLHADHGIHPDSAAVAGRVADLAHALGVPVEVGRLGLGAGTAEAAARRARYRWFQAAMRRTGARWLCLAHHADDQVETILMRALAGSGPAGLAGMAAVRGQVVRPLLGVHRDALRRVLVGSGWEAWEDPSNLDARHTRGWLRGTLLPMLEARDPRTRERLLRLGSQAAADRGAWEGVLAQCPGLDLREEPRGVSVAATPLSGYDSGLARALLRALARRAGATLDQRGADRLATLAGRGGSGAWVPLGGGWRGELAFGRLRIVPAPRPAAAREVSLAVGRPGQVRFGTWRITWGGTAGAGPLRRDGWTTRLIPGVYTLRGWQPGDRIRPLDGAGSRLVVRCMQDRKVARSERGAWPVLVAASGEVVWVPGVCRAGACLPATDEEGVAVDVAQS